MDLIKENLNVIYNLCRNSRTLDEDSVYEMIEFVADTHDVRIEKLHEEYIRYAEFIYPFIEKMYTLSEDLEWPYHIQSISKGEYPLEKIPSYLQEFTGKLYYKK